MTKKKEKIIIKFLKQNNILINLPKGTRKMAYAFYESNNACNKSFEAKKEFYNDVCSFLNKRKAIFIISALGLGVCLRAIGMTSGTKEKSKTKS